jgi:hypothetical protein
MSQTSLPIVADCFSDQYGEARAKFLEAALLAGLSVTSQIHPLIGRYGEELAMDVVRDGPADADRLLIITSACHGVEGYCGSGVQVFALRDLEWRHRARSQGVALLFIHALNPYGFSYTRRVTHENVDLNRNGLDFTRPLPENPAYRALHSLLLPKEWPPAESVISAIESFIEDNGMGQFQAALTLGQYEFPDGLFFGGFGPTWSNQSFRSVIKSNAISASRIAWIDIHTGLGPCGAAELIHSGKDDPEAIGRARRWWGDRVTSFYDGSSASSQVTGSLTTSLYDECGESELTPIALEFGTVPLGVMLNALRAEQWLQNNLERTPEKVANAIKRDMREAFYIETEWWKNKVISQAMEAIEQAIDGLSMA